MKFWKKQQQQQKPEHIIILHMGTINNNHMMFGSWDMKRDRQNFLSFWTVFCPFTPLANRKIKKKKKHPWDIIILPQSNKNHDPMLYCSLDMAHNRLNCYFSFWAIFYLFASLAAQIIQNLKKWKKNKTKQNKPRYHHFTTV